MLRGIRGSRPGHSSPALDRRDQRGFLAADKRPRAELEVYVEIKSCAEDIRAQQSPAAGFVDCISQPLDREGIFGAHVDVALIRADRIAADGHSFDQAERVALDCAAVHERAGVALVGIADHIALLGRELDALPPLEARRIPAAAAAPQPERSISSITCSGVMFSRTFASAS